MALAPTDHPHRAFYFTNLAIAYLKRFEQTDSIVDIDHAIEANEQALALIPDDHPERAIGCGLQGSILEKLFERTGSIKSRDKAIAAFEQAATTITAYPSVRIKAARSASRFLIGLDNDRALRLLQMAVPLLLTLSPRVLKYSDQQYNISEFAGLASIAASLSLECGGKPYDALYLLELGRGVLASLQVEVRSDIPDLKSLYPIYAQQFDDIRNQLDPPRSHLVQPTSGTFQTDSDHRRSLSNQFDKLLDSIRKLKGFEQFLLGPSESQLTAMAEYGSIVIFNVSEIRSDAFLIEKSRIHHLQLPLLQHRDLEDMATRFLTVVQSLPSLKTYSNSRREMIKILERLWDVAVEPVLDVLGFTRTPTEKERWPRVWWVGSGLLTILPIHAAGYHNPGSSALDRVISSYTPTVKSLAYAFGKLKSVERLTRQNALLVAMPKTSGKRDLPFVEKEIENLRSLLPSTIQTTVIHCPTRADILSLLHEHNIIHLSCHGQVSPEDPSQSKIFLSDWQTVPLTVAELTSVNIPESQFAYLSACHTSSTRNLRLLDESISLSSAFQLAGYPSVVGTLWQVHDEHSPDVAGQVYASMLDGGNKLNTRRSAEALHQAVRVLREKTRQVRGHTTDPLVWASYIHLGV